MLLTAGCIVIPVIHSAFRQLSGPDHRKHESPTVMRVMDLMIILGGMTGMLHPLDDVIIWQFKAHICHSFTEWLHKTHETVLTGCFKRTMTEMCQWILRAW
jgi:hypothetical protein